MLCAMHSAQKWIHNETKNLSCIRLDFSPFDIILIHENVPLCFKHFFIKFFSNIGFIFFVVQSLSFLFCKLQGKLPEWLDILLGYCFFNYYVIFAVLCCAEIRLRSTAYFRCFVLQSFSSKGFLFSFHLGLLNLLQLFHVIVHCFLYFVLDRQFPFIN